MKAAILLLLLSLYANRALARVSTNITPAHPIYDLLETLEGYACVQPHLRVLQPQSFASLKQAIFLPKGQTCGAPEWLLKKTSIFQPPILLPSATASLFLSQDDLINLPGIEAQLAPLYPLTQGRPESAGANLNLELNLSGAGGGKLGFAFGLQPGVLLGASGYQNLLTRFYMQQWYLKAAYKQLELSYGRMSQGFGEARHGTLILSQAARPMLLAKLAVQTHRLGGGFQFLGPFSFELWTAGLGDSQFVNDSKLLALAFGFRPHTAFELGFIELFQFGGEGIASMGAGDLLKMIFQLDAASLENKRSRRFGFHFNLWATQHVLKLYTQFFFEKLNSFSTLLSQDMSVLLGVFVPRGLGGSLRLEYVHNVPSIYESSLHGQGYTHNQTPLGHPLGSDSDGVYLDYDLSPIAKQWFPSLSLFYESRLRNPSATQSTEFRYGLGGKIAKHWSANTQLSLSTRYAAVKNNKFVHGDTANIVAVFAQLRLAVGLPGQK